MMDTMRKAGSKNVLISDGQEEQFIDSNGVRVPAVRDSLNNFAYSVHPRLRPSPGNNPSTGEINFGYLEDKGKTVIATEWSEDTGY